MKSTNYYRTYCTRDKQSFTSAATHACGTTLCPRALRTLWQMAYTLTLLFLASIAYSQNPLPGDMPYTPTKLEWAALDLQASYGATTMTQESPLMISFLPYKDGITVKCLLQYTSDFEAAALKENRESIEYSFKQYKKTKGWAWLRLEFQEHVIEKSWPNRN